LVENPTSPITNKFQNYALWTSGAFGTRLRAWRTLGEWYADDYSGPVVLRTLRSGGGKWAHDVHPCMVGAIFASFVADGYAPEEIMINEMAPDHRLLLNGEFLADVVPDGRWGHLHYSRVRKPMRISLREAPEEAVGLAAREILRSTMTAGSWEDFEELSLAYQGHVLELSVYDHCLGDVPGRNTLVWEVRRY
jgi:hypothetical protein